MLLLLLINRINLDLIILLTFPSFFIFLFQNESSRFDKKEEEKKGASNEMNLKRGSKNTNIPLSPPIILTENEWRERKKVTN